MQTTPRSTSLTTAATLLLAAAWVAGGVDLVYAEGETESTLKEQAIELIHENACRRAEAELARGERFYLVLDTELKSLSLKLHGAPLRELSLVSVEVGRPYRSLFERAAPGRVRGRVHRQSRLAPPRPTLRLPVEIPESSDDDTQTVMLPPEPESAISVPDRFFIRYDDGVALEFHTGKARRGFGAFILDAFSATFGAPELRLRLVLDRAEAEAFYRSVPRETDLLVR